MLVRQEQTVINHHPNSPHNHYHLHLDVSVVEGMIVHRRLIRLLWLWTQMMMLYRIVSIHCHRYRRHSRSRCSMCGCYVITLKYSGRRRRRRRRCCGHMCFQLHVPSAYCVSVSVSVSVSTIFFHPTDAYILYQLPPFSSYPTLSRYIDMYNNTFLLYIIRDAHALQTIVFIDDNRFCDSLRNLGYIFFISVCRMF